MKYRKEIDGLRAIAILPVIFFHAGSNWVTGGFVGVDVFFVISGFLITSLLLAEREAGSFSLTNFYERRARRILPALFCVILVCLPFAWFWMLPYQLKEFSQSLVAVATFASNILFWKQSGYFDVSAELKPLLHTWSLAVEEQYYVVFPLLVMMLWRFGHLGMRTLFVILALGSLGLAQYLIRVDATGAFYLLPTRAWELLIGALIPLCAGANNSTGPLLAVRQCLAMFGLVMIAGAVFLFDKHTPFPGLYALVPTVGAALVIRYGTAETLAGRLLSYRLFTGVGLISYSLYLWHQPVLAFYKLKTGLTEIPAQMFGPYLLLSLLLACLSYALVEKPFRSKRLVSRLSLFATTFAGIAGLGVLGYSGHASRGFLESKLAAVPEAKREFLIPVERQTQLRTAAANAQEEYLGAPVFGPESVGRRVVIVGDSMAEDLGTALAANRELFPGYSFRLLKIKTECLDALVPNIPITAGSPESPDCNSMVVQTLTSKLLASSDMIVLTGLWREGMDSSAVEGLMQGLKSINGNVLLLGSAGFLDIASISYKIATDERSYTQDELDELIAKSRRAKFDIGNTAAYAIADKLGVRYLDRHQLYCDTAERRCRILFLGGKTLIWDNAHLTVQGMRATAEQMAARGWLTQPPRTP
jgi:peptidoglycan/LPS O-acetylase OafA/YrhL